MDIQFLLKLLNCLLSDEAIKDIESSTKDQAACAKWNHQRKGKVTSSLLKRMIKGFVVSSIPHQSSNKLIDHELNY
ncbi:hypothetical protein NPIL_301591 [Nephila pilipes]|uniref:Uncharacterized protein n=1 Tax=Nephila pilipes TaxID=299642 RepID=A0A8X6PH15_NEPPI|nr:hypothetical protein NPIL_301591 [Nephila pilipes]